MPPAQRRAAAGVIEELLQNPQQFGFFQAIRLLEGWLAEGGQSGQGLSRLNFRNSLALSFPPSEIESLVVQRHGEPTDSNRAGSSAASGDAAALALDAVLAASGGAANDAPHALHSHEVARIDLTPAFMGLLGVTGALPLYYTETLAQREHHHKDRAARAFLDVFSHRAVALFYQAWRKHRMAVQYEGARRQRFLPEVLALAAAIKALPRNDDTLAYADAFARAGLAAGDVAQLRVHPWGVRGHVFPRLSAAHCLRSRTTTRFWCCQAWAIARTQPPQRTTFWTLGGASEPFFIIT